MSNYFRRRSKIRIPITLSVVLMALNVALMVCWIILLSKWANWIYLTVGVVAFTITLAGLSAWLVLSLKEIALNHRQANFVDSVTHELKSPIAALRLYLETLSMRHLSDEKRREFHGVMASELERLDGLINQLLEVGRLDAIGENEEPSGFRLDELLRAYAEAACRQWKLHVDEVFEFELAPIVIQSRQIVLDLIFSNLVENGIKYAGDPPRVRLVLKSIGKQRSLTRIINNGAGVPHEERKKIFQIFYRGGSELERRRKGTGLGLYIVHTLVRKMRGRIAVHDRDDGESGCTFDLELPGCTIASGSSTSAERMGVLSEPQESMAPGE